MVFALLWGRPRSCASRFPLARSLPVAPELAPYLHTRTYAAPRTNHSRIQYRRRRVPEYHREERCAHANVPELEDTRDRSVLFQVSPPTGFGKMIQVNPDTSQKELADKTGVILFKDYWPRGNESEETGSGDHIDLWDKDEITGGSMFFRSMCGFFGVLSDLSHSKQIWFWEVE